MRHLVGDEMSHLDSGDSKHPLLRGGAAVPPTLNRNEEIDEVNFETSSELQHFIRSVCEVFKEVVNVSADPTRDAEAIAHWWRKGWRLYEFRLVIEYMSQNEKTVEYFKQNPSKLNLRGFLSTSGDRESRMEDLILGLKARMKLERTQEEKREVMKGLPLMLLRCGTRLPAGDSAAYSAHMRLCFGAKGGCF